MEETLKSFVEVPFSSVAVRLVPAMGLNCVDDVKFFEAECQIGKSKAMTYKTSDVDVALVIRGEGTELVVCLLSGVGLTEAVKAIAEQARNAFKTVRYHTIRKGFSRLVDRAGFSSELIEQNGQGQESVYRVVL